MVVETEESAFVKAMRESTEAGYPLVGERLRAKLEQQGARVAASKPGPRPRSE
jgi:hypothetical protein